MNRMNIPKEIEETLKKLGLTGNEIKVYMMLLSSGPLTAKEISEYSNVPFSKIYLILNSLKRKGWISHSDSRPTKYFSLSPDEAVKRARINMEREWDEAVGKVTPILQSIYDTTHVSEAPDVWIVKGEENISSKVFDLLLKSQFELLMAIHRRLESLFDQLTIMERLGRAYTPKQVKILVPRDLVDDAKYLARFGAELRYRDVLFGGGVIADNKEALLLLGEDRVNTAIWSTHYTLIYLAKTYFDKLWDTAQTVEV